jgi:hypothetical protein
MVTAGCSATRLARTGRRGRSHLGGRVTAQRYADLRANRLRPVGMVELVDADCRRSQSPVLAQHGLDVFALNGLGLRQAASRP